MSTPISVALYYLEQEIYCPGLRVQNNLRGYLNQALDYIRQNGHKQLGNPELRVLVAAAQRRDRLAELDDVIIESYWREKKCSIA
jgi:hypothetical protein